jgi:signal transduction histidine kinase
MGLNSLSVKVLLAYVAGTALCLLLTAVFAVTVLRSHGDHLSVAEVADATRGMSRKLKFDSQGVPVGFHFDKFDLQWIFESLKRETAFRVMDASGQVVLSSAAGPAFWPPGGASSRLERGSFDFTREGVVMRGATESVTHDGRTWFVQFAASKRFLELSYRAFAFPFAGIGIAVFSLVLLFVFGVCAYFTLRLTLRPLRELSESAAAISPRSLHARLPTQAVPTEIAPLVHSFNRVLERLEQGYRNQREFLATAAHELKTPLALIRAQVELGEPTPERSLLLQDVAHMSRQVQQLLHLAEASETQNYQLALVDVAQVAHEAADYLRRMADAAEVRLDLPARAVAVHWQADRGALFTLLKNLLENAIQHTPPGTLVRVEVQAHSLSVRDWGPAVPQDELAQIFVRFWRGAHRRDEGAGLGLSICQEIALAHGWALQAARAQPGLRVVLSRPVSPAVASLV